VIWRQENKVARKQSDMIVAVALPCDKNVVAKLALLLIGGKVEK